MSSFLTTISMIIVGLFQLTFDRVERDQQIREDHVVNVLSQR